MSKEEKPIAEEVTVEITEKEKTQLDKMKAISESHVIEVIKDIATPKVEGTIESAPEFIKKHEEMLTSIGLFLLNSERSHAVGLAANQVSCNGKRIEHNFFLIKQNMGNPNSGFDIIFNPEIVEKRGTVVTKYEDCLTWSEQCVKVDRQPFIVVKYQDMNGVKHEGIAVTGFEAQVWQHEIDHLQGVEEKLVFKSERQKDYGLKIGRNDPCTCGSGKKYKKCCHFYDSNW